MNSLQLLEAALKEKNRVEIPKEFKSVEAWSSEWRMSYSHTSRLLLRAFRAGFAERQRVAPALYYKLLFSKK